MHELVLITTLSPHVNSSLVSTIVLSYAFYKLTGADRIDTDLIPRETMIRLREGYWLSCMGL